MTSPTLEELRRLLSTGTYERVPIMRELYADSFTTIQTLRALCEVSNHVFLLESAEPDQRWGATRSWGTTPPWR